MISWILIVVYVKSCYSRYKKSCGYLSDVWYLGFVLRMSVWFNDERWTIIQLDG